MTTWHYVFRADRGALGPASGRESSPHSLISPPAGSLPLAADCFISRLHLHDYVDGEIGADHSGSALREIILEHLALCPRCSRLERQVRAFRLRLRSIGERLTEQAEEQPSAEFRARVARLLAG